MSNRYKTENLAGRKTARGSQRKRSIHMRKNPLRLLMKIGKELNVPVKQMVVDRGDYTLHTKELSKKMTNRSKY